jgi:hypothetical protein
VSGIRVMATSGLSRGAITPRPASRPAGVRMPPRWKTVTALLSRGAIRPRGLAVGRPGAVGKNDLLSRGGEHRDRKKGGQDEATHRRISLAVMNDDPGGFFRVGLGHSCPMCRP